MVLYEKLLYFLDCYFCGITSWNRLFLNGGCFWLANYLCERIPGSYLVINRLEEHCALCIEGSIYDVRGKISKCGFHKASEREISFMKKNYLPKFDVVSLEKYLEVNEVS